jgi:predicted RNase H-like HicB family nuclease
MTRRYAVAVVREGDEYWAFVPDVPGVYGRGANVDEAQRDVSEALAEYLSFLRERGEAAPEQTSDALEVRYAEVTA